MGTERTKGLIGQLIYDYQQSDIQQTQEQVRKEMEKSKEMVPSQDKDFEGGFGGQEDLEDRYATTSGDH